MSAANHKYIFDKQTLTLARKVILLRSDFIPIPSNPSRTNSIKLHMLHFQKPEDPTNQTFFVALIVIVIVIVSVEMPVNVNVPLNMKFKGGCIGPFFKCIL